MAYTPTTWVTGDTITATKLNNIESGVQSVSSSYTPTTWATGDTITAVKLNNIEQGIANASGGSSDFSTAEVTIINSTVGSLVVPIARTQEAIPPIIPNELISPYITVNAGETVVVPTVLYKGTGVIACGSESDAFDGYPIATSLTVTSGSATVNFNEDVEVTGDCTITIS